MKEESQQFEGYKYQGFKLINLKIMGSKLFGDIEYNFVDETDKQDKIYTTVIIGPNGTKKSLLFNLIIFIFKSINDLKNNKSIDYEANSKYSTGFYHITYSLNHHIYEFRRYAENLTQGRKFSYELKIDGKQPAEIKDFELPLNIVANSINITDKFPVLKEGEFPRYHYLGIKYSPQSASTKSYLKKIIGYVARLSFNEAFLNGLNSIAKNFIGNGKEICITYKTSQHKKFFSGDLKIEALDKYFNDIEEDYKKKGKTPPFKLNNYRSLRSKEGDKIQELIKYCDALGKDEGLVQKKGQSNRTITFKLSESKDLQKLKNENVFINQLYSIGLLYDVKIEFEDGINDNYSIEDSSSGEYNLITSFIGLMATVTQNSLVLIDEPEISLHPNWQMQYISFLKEIYDHEVYKTSHILIATHSHFIVSDLEGDSSKVIGLSKDEKVSIVPLDEHLNTFGWSAEDVLYNVFNVVSTRNKFVAEDIANLLNELSEGNKNKVNKLPKAKYDELINLENSLKESDPLKTVVKSILQKVNK